MSAIGKTTAAERDEIRKLREVPRARAKYIYKVTATTTTGGAIERRIVADDAVQAIRIMAKSWAWGSPNVTAVVLESSSLVWGA